MRNIQRLMSIAFFEIQGSDEMLIYVGDGRQPTIYSHIQVRVKDKRPDEFAG
jgi:hypothetical protein